MVLSVLLLAGAVPLSDDQQVPSNVFTSSFVQPSTQFQQQQPGEYVQFLESLVGELSCVFASWVHQNPPPSPTHVDMYQQRRANTCRPLTTTTTTTRSSGYSGLPDLIPHHCSDKKSCSPSSPSTGAELRVRRGLAPMRFRLDSVGSSTYSAASSPVTTPTSANSFATSPMNFDLLPSPTSAASTVSFFADDLSSPPATPGADDTDSPVAVPDTLAADWRQVGRDLRGIADHFASTRASRNGSADCQSWALNLIGSPLTSAGPIVSALAVYLWWKIVRRLTA